MGMDNSDGSTSETASDTALKRPSARRATSASEPPPEAVTGEITARIPRRVHARRPAGEPAQEENAESTGPWPSTPPPAAEAPAALGSAQPLPRAAPRASARGARASRSSSVPPAPHSSVAAEAAQPLAAESLDTESAPPQAADLPLPAAAIKRTRFVRERASDVHAIARGRQPADLPASRGGELLETPMASALARADFSDDFGLDAGYEAKLRPWLEALCKRYFHVDVVGAHNIPAEGRALLVANHSRSALWDGIILRTALRLQHENSREPRWLVDDQQYHAPFLGTFVNRLGAVRACQENAERLLLREELVAVFPEGAKAAERRFEDRFRLQRFGRGGYVKLALRTGAPVIPVAIVAHDRDYASWLSRLSSASRLLSTPMLALGPGLPRLGRLGVPPIASHIQICIGEPVREIARQDALAIRDDGLVHELNECVRGAVQQLVNTSLQL